MCEVLWVPRPPQPGGPSAPQPLRRQGSPVVQLGLCGSDKVPHRLPTRASEERRAGNVVNVVIDVGMVKLRDS